MRALQLPPVALHTFLSYYTRGSGVGLGIEKTLLAPETSLSASAESGGAYTEVERAFRERWRGGTPEGR